MQLTNINGTGVAVTQQPHVVAQPTIRLSAGRDAYI